ncbi:MAG TPA: acyloxyacyl hydrolase [Stellaceae bacterium]|nr:acyloxyacyl hydrolase [Stellaceae bacterium]
MRLRQRRRPCVGCRFLALSAAAVVLLPISTGAQEQHYLVLDEAKFAVLAHDVGFAGGKEGGADINAEILFASPVRDEAVSAVPPALRWLVQPRLNLGFEANTGDYTDQGYFGLTWTRLVARDLLRPADGLEVSIGFGPSFNDGLIRSRQSDRKSLGSHVLFHVSFELGYRITPRSEVSAFFDHSSNAGFVRENESVNDAGFRFGIRF